MILADPYWLLLLLPLAWLFKREQPRRALLMPNPDTGLQNQSFRTRVRPKTRWLRWLRIPTGAGCCRRRVWNGSSTGDRTGTIEAITRMPGTRSRRRSMKRSRHSAPEDPQTSRSIEISPSFQTRMRAGWSGTVDRGWLVTRSCSSSCISRKLDWFHVEARLSPRDRPRFPPLLPLVRMFCAACSAAALT